MMIRILQEFSDMLETRDNYWLSGAAPAVSNMRYDDPLRTLLLAPYPSEMLPYQFREISGQEYYGPDYQDVGYRVPDVTNAQEILGWTPRVSLEEALRLTIA